MALWKLYEVANAIDHLQERFTDFYLNLDRCTKMFFILPDLFLREIKAEITSEVETSRGSKALVLKGISDIAKNEAINKQMNFPEKGLYHLQRNKERASIERDLSRITIMQLKCKVSSKLSGFRYPFLS